MTPSSSYAMSPSSSAPILPDEPTRIRAALSRAPIFASLPAAAIEELAGRVQLRRFGAGRTVVSEDDAGDSLFLVMSGRVKAVIFGETGREVTLAILRPGEAFGEVSLFDGRTRSASCVAIEPTHLIVLERNVVLDLIASHPRAAMNLLGEMAARLRRADEAIAQLALCDVNQRLVRRLVSLAAEEGSATPEGVLVRRRPTQQELANMVGSCRETISRAFNQLARDGLIIPRGRAMVVTSELIEKARRGRAAKA
jgi:CRP/FNR family cyclic AMP-dependent transcriptional regulator